MRLFWWIALISGLIFSVWIFFHQAKFTAPLNPSGYTYPSSPGA
jgi:tellurite resistance protein TehA-like permease